MSDELEVRVREILAVVLSADANDDVALTRSSNASWDSLKHVEILFALEEELGVRFEQDELTSLDSVKAVVDAAGRHLSE